MGRRSSCEEGNGRLLGEKGKGKQYHHPYDFEAAGKDINWGRGGENQALYAVFENWIPRELLCKTRGAHEEREDILKW